MMTLASCFFSLVAVLLAIPTGVFSLEILAAVFLAKRSTLIMQERENDLDRGALVVLVPAHNESANLRPTLQDINGQLRPGDRLVVVADNCNDDTAAVAAASGAEVTERSDMTRIGKGYALDRGIRYLADNPPQTVIVIDADCRVLPRTLEYLVAQSRKTSRPVQALYLMTAPDGSKLNHQVAEFAWRLKNWVRPLGLHKLGLPCQLVGSGMAFPWEIIRSADLSTGFIVEDLKLGLDLAQARQFPKLCPEAIVTSTFPNSAEGAKTQRQRWEHGQIRLMLSRGASLAASAICRRDLNLLSLVLDLMVPPLTLFGLMLVAATTATAIVASVGLSVLPFIICITCLSTFSLSIGIAWLKYGRDLLPVRSAGLLISYLATKINHYAAAVFSRGVTTWIRTDRG